MWSCSRWAVDAQTGYPERGCEFADTPGGQGAQCDGPPGGPAGQADQATGQGADVLVAGGEHGQYPFVDQATEGKDQGTERVGLGPLDVVDDQQHGRLLPEVLQRLEHQRARVERLARRALSVPPDRPVSGPHPRHPQDLVEHPVGDQCLPFLAAGPDEPGLCRFGQESFQQRGFPDSCRAAQQDRLWLPGLDGAPGIPELGELVRSADERFSACRHRQVLTSAAGGGGAATGRW